MARLIGSLAFVWVALEGGVCSSINPVPCKQVRPERGEQQGGAGASELTELSEADNGSASFLGSQISG